MNLGYANHTEKVLQFGPPIYNRVTFTSRSI